MTSFKFNKEEILKGNKWIRFLFMFIYGAVLWFGVIILVTLSLIQFLFYLFTSKINEPLADFNSTLIGFIDDIVAFMLFSTDKKPFPFNKPKDNGEVIEAESEIEIDYPKDEEEVLEEAEVAPESIDTIETDRK